MAELSARLPSLSDAAAVVALRGIAASIGDGHTFVATPPRPKFPVEFCWFGDQLAVVRATAAHRTLIGTQLVAIGEQPVADVQGRLQQLIPQGENAGYVLAQSVELMREPEVLSALGIPPRFRFIDTAGTEVAVTLGPGDEPLLTAEHAPLSMQRMDEPFWFSHVAERDAVYVQFRSYGGLEANAIRLFDDLRQQPARRLIVDLRRNGGGNFLAGRQWLLLPIELLGLVAGQLFVLVGRRTFSASMVNAIDFHRETEAILVGEPIGARPFGYQENGWFTLPGSGLRVSAATRLYRFGPEDADSFHPDQQIDTSYADFVAGRDPVLEWALGA
ncbi:hypothetical protein ASC89_10175 [Devosia sp. Root413D1]|uniref:S41 family peptidase n=1 Tax=Devosia sp. Root413D1 TaxID=1736531 RepID=UPI0006F84400|nr:S41 family peptidase [Devosia sp. Root413D1]KQW80433.1 hypothetical protein ASC89_10175 [Devosia sp. Root413D1]